MEIVKEILARVTTELLIEKTNDPEAERDRDGDYWVHGTWQDEKFREDLVVWMLERENQTESETYYINGPELGEECIATREEWEQFLTEMEWHSFDENLADESLRVAGE